MPPNSQISWPDKIINTLFPHRCMLCGEVVHEAHALCPKCWPNIHFIVPPFCDCCGLPFPHDFGGATLCARCLADPPPFSSARAAVTYDDNSKPLVLRFKHGDQLYLAPSFAHWMRRAAAEWTEPAYLVPVPLHWTRLMARRYNQAALLARSLAKISPHQLALDALVRKRKTPSQGAMNREQRLKNVTGAFRVRKHWREKLRGQCVILLDDVLTTGATVTVCAAALRRAGAADVKVLTLMRVA
jgi:ComF family protein